MYQDLERILQDELATQAAETELQIGPDTLTPDSVFINLRTNCRGSRLKTNVEADVTGITNFLSALVINVFNALMANTSKALLLSQVRAIGNTVITDNIYYIDGKPIILWEDKSPEAFDRFIGQRLMQAIGGDGQVDGGQGHDWVQENITLHDHEAILAKLAYHAMESETHVRWAIVFSGLDYIITYIPRKATRPVLYCSPIMHFCIDINSEEEEGRPPLWSLIVYMLLADKLNVSDDTLRQVFGLPVPLEDVSSPRLGSITNAEGDGRPLGDGEGHSGRLAGIERGKAANDMLIQTLDSLPMALSLVGVSQPLSSEKQRPFVHLDRFLGGGWSAVYASSGSHIVIKFGRVPGKDKNEVERFLRIEKAAYEQLPRLCRWFVPCFIGEYKWYGGQALVLSDEGPSLEALGMEFASLGLVERIVLFGQLYLLHRFGVCHCDFEPRNVLRNGWCRLVIIDFAFSDLNHRCPGWRKCRELQVVSRELRIDKLHSDHKVGMASTSRSGARVSWWILIILFMCIPNIYLFSPLLVSRVWLILLELVSGPGPG